MEKIAKPNNLKVFERKKTEESKQDSQNQQKLKMPDIQCIRTVHFNYKYIE